MSAATAKLSRRQRELLRWLAAVQGDPTHPARTRLTGSVRWRLRPGGDGTRRSTTEKAADSRTLKSLRARGLVEGETTRAKHSVTVRLTPAGAEIAKLFTLDSVDGSEGSGRL